MCLLKYRAACRKEDKMPEIPKAAEQEADEEVRLARWHGKILQRCDRDELMKIVYDQGKLVNELLENQHIATEFPGWLANFITATLILVICGMSVIVYKILFG